VEETKILGKKTKKAELASDSESEVEEVTKK